MTATCIDLRAVFGSRFRVTLDHESAEGPRDNSPWVQQILCQGRGVIIYPQGGDMLAVEVNHRRTIAAKLASLPGVRIHQDGDHEKTFLVAAGLFDQVAEIVRPRRRRTLTQAQRQALSAHAFQPRDGARKTALKRARTAA